MELGLIALGERAHIRVGTEHGARDFLRPSKQSVDRLIEAFCLELRFKIL